VNGDCPSRVSRSGNFSIDVRSPILVSLGNLKGIRVADESRVE
jgi:hypothetical protein